MLRMHLKYWLFCLLLLAVIPARADIAAWQAHLEAARQAAEITFAYVAGDWQAAVRHYKAAVKEAEGFGANDPRLADTLELLALCYLHPQHSDDQTWLSSNYDKRAEALILRARAIRDAAFGKNSLQMAKSECMLGHLCTHRDGEEVQAEEHYQAAVKMLEKAVPRDAATVAEIVDLAIQYYSDAGQAVPLLRQAITVFEQAYGKEDPWLADRLYMLAGYLQDEKESLALYQRALQNAEKAYGIGDPRTGEALYQLGQYYIYHHREEDGNACLARLLANTERAYGMDDIRLLSTLYRLAGGIWPTPKTLDDGFEIVNSYEPRADEYLRRAANIAAGTGDRAAQIEAWGRLAALYRHQGRGEDAWRPLEAALQSAEAAYGKDDPRILPPLYLLAEWTATEDAVRMVPLYRRALAIVDKRYGNDLPAIEHLRQIAAAFEQAELHGEAQALQRRVADILVTNPDADPDDAVKTLVQQAVASPPGINGELPPALARVIAYVEKIYGPDSPELASLLQQSAYLMLVNPPEQPKTAVLLLHRLVGLLPKIHPAGSAELASALSETGNLLEQARASEEAIAARRQALAIIEALPTPAPQFEYAVASSLGALFEKTGNIREAEALLKRCVDLCEKGNPEELENSLFSLSRLYLHAKEYAKADAVYARTYALQVKRSGAAGISALTILLARASCCRQAGRYPEAEKYLLQVQKTAEQAGEPRAPYGEPGGMLGTIFVDRIRLYQAWGKTAEAAACLQRLQEMAASKNAVMAEIGANGIYTLIRLHRVAGRHNEVVTLLQFLLSLREAQFGKESPQIVGTLLQLGEACTALGNLAAAEAYYTRVVHIEDVQDTGEGLRGLDADRGIGYSEVAKFYRAQKRYADEEALWRRRLERDRKRYGEEILAYRRTLISLGEVLILQTKYTEAEALLLPLLETEQAQAAAHAQAVSYDLLLAAGNLYLAEGKLEKAEPLLRDAFTAVEKTYQYADTAERLLPYVEAYAAVLHALKRDTGARIMDDRITSLREESARFREQMTDEHEFQ